MIYLISHAPCVATYLRCGGDVNNQIRKGFLLSLPVKKSKIGECLATLQARTWLTRALSSSFCIVLARRTKFHRVVWQHMQGVVEVLITSLLIIY